MGLHVAPASRTTAAPPANSIASLSARLHPLDAAPLLLPLPIHHLPLPGPHLLRPLPLPPSPRCPLGPHCPLRPPPPSVPHCPLQPPPPPTTPLVRLLPLLLLCHHPGALLGPLQPLPPPAASGNTMPLPNFFPAFAATPVRD
ncbi:hypothetical protein AAC387_Pa02g0734 [Persea americana]